MSQPRRTSTPQLLIKLLLRTIGLFCLIFIGSVTTMRVTSRIQVNTEFVNAPEGEGIDLYVISNGIHTDLVFPAKNDQVDWTEKFDPAAFEPSRSVEEVRWIAFGYGEQNLWQNVPTWGDLTAYDVVHAMLIPTRSAMHVTYYSGNLRKTDLVRHVRITPEQYEILIDHVERSFDRDPAGETIDLSCCWFEGRSDAFYEATTLYQGFYTCNNWTNAALRKAGIPTALWTPFHDVILNQLNDVSIRE